MFFSFFCFVYSFRFTPFFLQFYAFKKRDNRCQQETPVFWVSSSLRCELRATHSVAIFFAHFEIMTEERSSLSDSSGTQRSAKHLLSPATLSTSSDYPWIELAKYFTVTGSAYSYSTKFSRTLRDIWIYSIYEIPLYFVHYLQLTIYLFLLVDCHLLTWNTFYFLFSLSTSREPSEKEWATTGSSPVRKYAAEEKTTRISFPVHKRFVTS